MLAETELLLKAGINIVEALILTYAIFYRRYKNKDLFVSSMILNICIFSVMSIITDGTIGLQAGLGLFAILSILRFRSENFKKMDMSYFFGAVAIAAINGIGELGPIILIANMLIIIVVFVIDSKFIMLPVSELKVCLDSIPDYLFNPELTKRELGKKFNIKVLRFEVNEIDYVKDTATILLHFNSSDSDLNKPKIMRWATRSAHTDEI